MFLFCALQKIYTAENTLMCAITSHKKNQKPRKLLLEHKLCAQKKKNNHLMLQQWSGNGKKLRATRRKGKLLLKNFNQNILKIISQSLKKLREFRHLRDYVK